MPAPRARRRLQPFAEPAGPEHDVSVVGVIGLGYVGLPLVVEFGKLGRTIGFDIVEDKVARCRAASTRRARSADADMAPAVHADLHQRSGAARRSRLHPRRRADAGRRRAHPRLRPAHRRQPQRRPHLKPGAIVVYESTVYPGRDRGGLHPGARARLGPDVEAATSSSATAPSASTRATREHTLTNDRQGRLRRHARDARQGGASSTSAIVEPGRPPLLEHQGRRGRAR